MNKNRRRKSSPKADGKQASSVAGTQKQPTRRAILRNFATIGAVGVAAVVGGGFVVRGIATDAAEANLDVIGQGIPVIVQIHDPNCPICRSLQREVRAALRNFGDDQLLYRVANLKTERGASFASDHGQGHITLILLDAEGRRELVLNGMHDSQTLVAYFRDLAARK